MNRRQFMRIGSVLAPAVALPTITYSFLWAPISKVESKLEENAYGRYILVRRNGGPWVMESWQSKEYVLSIAGTKVSGVRGSPEGKWEAIMYPETSKIRIISPVST